MIETAENSLKNQPMEIENKLINDKRVFGEMLTEIKMDVDKFKDYELKEQEGGVQQDHSWHHSQTRRTG